MRADIFMLSAFAAFWAIGALVSLGSPPWTWTVPLLLGAVVARWCARAVSGAPVRAASERRRIGRLVGLWSAVELVLIVAVSNLLANAGLIHFVVPAIALIVGLHFLPLAHGTPQPLYYATAAALVLSGLSGMTLADPYAWTVTGLAGALSLWSRSLAIASQRRPRDARVR